MAQNLLHIALQNLAKQSVQYLAFDTNHLMDDGSLTPIFQPPITLQGSLQPITTTQKLALGLNLTSNYARFFVSSNALSALPNTAPSRAHDRINFQSCLYAITAECDWAAQNGWKELFLTQIDTD